MKFQKKQQKSYSSAIRKMRILPILTMVLLSASALAKDNEIHYTASGINIANDNATYYAETDLWGWGKEGDYRVPCGGDALCSQHAGVMINCWVVQNNCELFSSLMRQCAKKYADAEEALAKNPPDLTNNNIYNDLKCSYDAFEKSKVRTYYMQCSGLYSCKQEELPPDYCCWIAEER